MENTAWMKDDEKAERARRDQAERKANQALTAA